MTTELKNVIKATDDKRCITIYHEGNDSFIIHTEDYEGLNETLVEYSLESMVKTYRLMDLMINEVCLKDKDIRKRLLSIDKPKIEVGRV